MADELERFDRLTPPSTDEALNEIVRSQQQRRRSARPLDNAEKKKKRRQEDEMLISNEADTVDADDVETEKPQQNDVAPENQPPVQPDGKSDRPKIDVTA